MGYSPSQCSPSHQFLPPDPRPAIEIGHVDSDAPSYDHHASKVLRRSSHAFHEAVLRSCVILTPRRFLVADSHSIACVDPARVVEADTSRLVPSLGSVVVKVVVAVVVYGFDIDLGCTVRGVVDMVAEVEEARSWFGLVDAVGRIEMEVLERDMVLLEAVQLNYMEEHMLVVRQVVDRIAEHQAHYSDASDQPVHSGSKKRVQHSCISHSVERGLLKLRHTVQ